MPTPLGAPLLGPSQASRYARRGRGRLVSASIALAACACAPAPEPRVVLSAPLVVAPPPAPATAPAPAPAASSVPLPPPVAKAQCDVDRAALWDSYRRSRERPCTRKAECVVVITPNSPVLELATVVHTADRPRLEQDARALLERCGAFSVYRPNNAIRVVEAACIEGRCAESETVLHVED